MYLSQVINNSVKHLSLGLVSSQILDHTLKGYNCKSMASSCLGVWNFLCYSKLQTWKVGPFFLKRVNFCKVLIAHSLDNLYHTERSSRKVGSLGFFAMCENVMLWHCSPRKADNIYAEFSNGQEKTQENMQKFILLMSVGTWGSFTYSI